MTTTKVLLITYSTEEDHENCTKIFGINTYIFDADETDIQQLERVDQMWIQDCMNSKDKLIFYAGCYVDWRMGDAFDEFMANADFSIEERDILLKDHVGKWLDHRHAGINDCADVKRYFTIDLSYDRVFH